MKTICVIDGHPDPDGARFIHALSNAYSDGANLPVITSITFKYHH